MNCLTYPLKNDEEIFKCCTQKCGFITTSDDQQYFTLSCIFCTEKFLYFDAFIDHMQTKHRYSRKSRRSELNKRLAVVKEEPSDSGSESEDELRNADASILEPQMVMIKGEVIERNDEDDNEFITGLPSASDLEAMGHNVRCVKSEPPDVCADIEENSQNYESESNGNDDYEQDDTGENDEHVGDEDDSNYDDMVELSLLRDTNHTGYIKDRKMIKFLIDAYRRNPFLWDHRHPRFRDRIKRQQFLDWIVHEFERRFNVKIFKEAVTRKWDNLRTVYKRECNRMTQENTNISTLWYFKELHFINRLYGNQRMSEAVVKETFYRRRYSALWNDISTGKLLEMVRQYPCFYVKTNPDYRIKEKRGEALQRMAHELQKIIHVSSIQISKRLSQLRFDYSKQKIERFQCEKRNKMFVPSYAYYDQMLFMDADIAPFKCELCSVIIQNSSELDIHMLTHQPAHRHKCNVCSTIFYDSKQYQRHRASHQTSVVNYQCDLCNANFSDKNIYDEHVQQHNDELLLPTLAATDFNTKCRTSGSVPDRFFCELCGKSFSHRSYLNAHRQTHASLKCDIRRCGKLFKTRQDLTDHLKFVHNEEYRCEICGKIFKSSKNLSNHKQIHDAIKRYICKICGSAFAQAAGLYLHKRRHNRPNSRILMNN